jgi:polyhydroxybutyrate depolymerase
VESASVNGRRRVLVAVLVLLGLPVVLVLIEAVSYRVRNRHNGSFVSSGRQREYLLYVPKSYDRTRPTPLVISLHGGAMWGAAQRDISQWNEQAERHGLLVVYPSGRKGVGPRAWRVNDPAMRDVKFISELIDTLRVAYNIDSTRVYADGVSNGGGMAFVLSCTLSDRIAAVGLVGAAHLTPWTWCTERRAVPMIAFHGTDDRFTPYDGGTTIVAPQRFPSIRVWTANWARRNRCASNPIDSAVAVDVVRRTYRNCADGADVVLYTVLDGGHTWPGGGPLPEWFAGRTSHSVDATSVMWAFFREHPLRKR